MIARFLNHQQYEIRVVGKHSLFQLSPPSNSDTSPAKTRPFSKRPRAEPKRKGSSGKTTVFQVICLVFKEGIGVFLQSVAEFAPETKVSSRMFFFVFPSEALPPRRGSRNSGWGFPRGLWLLFYAEDFGAFFHLDFVGEAFLKQNKRYIFLKQLKMLTIDFFLVGLPGTYCFFNIPMLEDEESFRGFP